MDKSPNTKWIDISRGLISSPVYPGDPIPYVSKLYETEKGDDYTLSALSTGLHAGTHIDAPMHFIPGGKSIDEYPVSAFAGPCRVVKAKGFLTGAWIEQMCLYKCEKLLIKGEGAGKLDRSAAEEIIASGVKLVGIDSNTIGMQGQEADVHRTLLGNGCLILEGLNLSDVEPDDYYLMAFPVKIEGAEAAPCRAVLAKDFLVWSK